MKYILYTFLFFHVSLFANTFVLFSNNTHSSYKITSQILDTQTNLQAHHDYDPVSNITSVPFLPNLNVLRFNSNVNIKNGREYPFLVTISNLDYPDKIIKFFITTKGLWTGSKITKTQLELPDGSLVNYNPEKSAAIFVHEWNNSTLYFVPFWRTDSGVSWPSFVISTDEDLSDHFDFSSANTFKAINYNIQLFPFYGDLMNNPNHRSERAKRIPQLIKDDYDYVSLNEVFDKDLRAQIIRDMEEFYPYHVEPPGMEGHNILSGGVLTFSKWPILETKQYVYQNCSAEECLANKGITYIKIKKTVDGIAQNYNIFSTHVQAFPNSHEQNPYFQPRAKQIRELKQFIEEQNIPQSEPVLISGDLNVDRYSDVMSDYHNEALQTEYEYLLSLLNAVDPVAVGLKYSFDAYLNTMIDTEEQGRYDYILYLGTHKSPINASNYVRTMRDMSNPKMYPDFDTSDHFPVIGDFIF